MKVAIGSDHAGYQLKSELAGELSRAGHEVTDLGTHGPEPVDYPDYALAVAEALAASDILVLINGRTARLVTHLDLSGADIDKTVSVIESALG